MQLIYKNNSMRFFTDYKDKGVNFCICNNLGTASDRSHRSSISGNQLPQTFKALYLDPELFGTVSVRHFFTPQLGKQFGR